ncbi:hypothetical protein ACFQGT_08995 [Natrialbaceae archaeon GCM10025810]|uniref:hypothetical protein n=1 Tax=Halovalidus salilacus TaxID=3075124 RepID=UPI00361D93AB
MATAHPTQFDPETLQTSLRRYLEGVDRAGDPERLAQRLAREHTLGSAVVGFRRTGREVLRYDDRTGALTIHEIGLDDHLPCLGTCWKGRNLEAWLREHRYYLEWVRPDLRR